MSPASSFFVRHNPSVDVVTSIRTSSFDVAVVTRWRRVVWVVVVLITDVFVCGDEFSCGLNVVVKSLVSDSLCDAANDGVNVESSSQ